MRIERVRRLAVIAVILGVSACTPPHVTKIKGQEYYTQFTMWSWEKGRYGQVVSPVKYAVHNHIPINTRVIVLDYYKGKVAIRVPSQHRIIYFYNEPGYSGVDIDKAFSRFFGKEKVDLSGFDENTRQSIIDGAVEKGMTREQMLLSRGRPPAHQTPDLDMPKWTYWKNRFDRIKVEFVEDRVVDIID